MPTKRKRTKVKRHLRRTKKKKKTVIRQHKRRVKKKRKKNFSANIKGWDWDPEEEEFVNKKTGERRRPIPMSHFRANFGALEIISDKDEIFIDDPLDIQRKQLRELERELGVDILLKDQGREIQLRPKIRKKKIRKRRIRRPGPVRIPGPGQKRTEEIFTDFRPTTFVVEKRPRGRPKGSRDKVKRKPRSIKSSTQYIDVPQESNIILIGKEKFKRIMESIGRR